MGYTHSYDELWSLERILDHFLNPLETMCVSRENMSKDSSREIQLQIYNSKFLDDLINMKHSQ